jgi:hypothetical protein
LSSSLERPVDIPLQPQLLYRFLRHLRRPARDSSALLIIVFATMLSVSLRAGAYGLYRLPVTLLLVSWFFKYAFVLFDHVVHGFDEPPTLVSRRRCLIRARTPAIYPRHMKEVA